MNGIPLGKLAIEVAKETYKAGLRMFCHTTDMDGKNGSANKWLGAQLGKNSKWIHYYPHPCDPTWKIYIVYDQAHLLKRLNIFLTHTTKHDFLHLYTILEAPQKNRLRISL